MITEATNAQELHAMSVPQLRALARSKGMRFTAIGSMNKAQLTELIESDGASYKGDDLADTIANALKGRIQAGMDEDRVKLLCMEMIDKAISSRPPAQKIILNDVETAVITERTHKALPLVLQCVTASLPVLLVGPAGTGKTTLAEHVAKALDLPFSYNSMSAGISESHLIGRTLPDSDGDWKYKPSPFVHSYENGGVHLFDEIDAADPNLMVLVNSALSNGHLSLPFENRVIARHEKSVIIAAANTYGRGADRQYHGRNALDGATLDRFAMSTIEIDYDTELEAEMAKDHPEILAWARQVRSKIEYAKLRRVMSTRTIKNAIALARQGMLLPTIQNRYFTGWSADERARVA